MILKHLKLKACFSSAFKTVLAIIILLLILPLAYADTDKDTEITIKVQSQDKLRFGKFSASRTGGAHITINPLTREKKVIGGIGIGSVDYGPAKFLVVGEPGRHFKVSLPQKTLFVSSFTVYIPSDQISKRFGLQNNKEGIYGYFDPTGKATIFVGGTLHVSSGSKKYGENFYITVEYV